MSPIAATAPVAQELPAELVNELIGDDDEFRQFFFQKANGLLNRAVISPPFGAGCILRIGNPEENYAAHARLSSDGRVFEKFIR